MPEESGWTSLPCWGLRSPASQTHVSILHLRKRRARGCRVVATKEEKRRIFWKMEFAQTLLWFCYKDHFLPDPADSTLCASGGLLNRTAACWQSPAAPVCVQLPGSYGEGVLGQSGRDSSLAVACLGAPKSTKEDAD